MPLDPYSSCPGGRNQKVKFCCPDLLKDLDELDVMLKGEQAGAALAKINTLTPTHPDCACLEIKKYLAQTMLNQYEEAFQTISTVRNREPDNLTASIYYVQCLAGEGKLQESLSELTDLLEKADPEKMPSMLLQLCTQIAYYFSQSGMSFIAAPLCQIVLLYNPEDKLTNNIMFDSFSMQEMPVLFRSLSFVTDIPDSCPEREKLVKCLFENTPLGRWKSSLKQLEELVPTVADSWPEIYNSIAILNIWNFNFAGAVDAWKKFYACPNISDDDKVETIRFLEFFEHQRILDETAFVYHLTYPLTDENGAIENLLSSSRLVAFDPESLTNRITGQRPRNCFRILSCAYAAPGEKPTLDTLPISLGALLLFGKRTDRSARLELVGITEEQKPAILDYLKSVLGENLGPEEASEVIGSDTWSQREIAFSPVMRNSDAAYSDEIYKLLEEYRTVRFPEKWCNHPMAMLDGKTPLEAAADPEYHFKLEAALSIFNDIILTDEIYDQIVGAIRTKLNLPPETITPVLVDENGQMDIKSQLFSINRMDRYDFSQVNTHQVVEIITQALTFKRSRTAERLAKMVIARPAKVEEYEDRDACYMYLIDFYRSCYKIDKALELIHQAAAEAASAGLSDGSWNIQEFICCFITGQVEQAQAIMQHLQTQHIYEENVMREYQTVLVQLGLIRPDGRPQQSETDVIDSLGIDRGGAFPAAGAPGESRLWTSNNPPAAPPAGNGNKDNGQAGTSGKSKLWIPD